MFTSRYFNPRYWASRFWPKVGGEPVVTPNANAFSTSNINDLLNSSLSSIEDINYSLSSIEQHGTISNINNQHNGSTSSIDNGPNYIASNI